MTVLLALWCSAPAAAQDGSLGVTLSLEANRTWKSETWTFNCLVEFRNRLKVPLRWHPTNNLYECEFGWGQTRLCFQSTDGRRYVHYRMSGFGPVDDRTEVLAPGASSYYGSELCEVIETDAEWHELTNEARTDDRYRGPLPEGTYDVWLRYFDGPDGRGGFMERFPAKGIYESNKVRLTVVPDGTPNVAQSHELLEYDGPRVPAYPFVMHGPTRMVWARHLKSYGVRAIPDEEDHALTLSRVNRRVVLPRLIPIDSWFQKDAPPAPAIRTKNRLRNDEEDYLVPLDYVEQKLGIHVTTEAPRK